MIRVGGAFAAVSLLAGCANPVALTETAAQKYYVHPQTHASNVIERGLVDCPTRTPDAEALCVKEAIDADDAAIADVVAAIPGCQVGHTCSYEFETIDRLGYVDVNPSVFSARWRVRLDFKHSPLSVSSLRVTVDQI